MRTRAILLPAVLIIAGGLALATACSSSAGPASPVDCGPGTVTCTTDSICCPGGEPFFCGGPADPENLGCYPTLHDASAVCGTQTVGGQTTTLAYQCR